jgi:hypothetical protein
MGELTHQLPCDQIPLLGGGSPRRPVLRQRLALIVDSSKANTQLRENVRS